MKLPYQRHLEWLVLEGQDDQAIRKFYYNIQFPEPTEAAISRARDKVSQLMIPPGVRRNLMRARFVMEDNPIWQKLGYGEIHARRCTKDPSRPWSEIGKVLNHPVMRLALECCLITRLDTEKITQLLPQTFTLPISKDAVDIFAEYFANFGDFDRSDWMEYLDMLREDNFTYTRIFTALTRSTEEVLFLLGLPTQKQYTDFLKNVLAAADFKFRYYARQNTPDSDADARKWAKVGFEAGEKFEKYGSNDITDFAKLVQTEFEYVIPEIPTATPELLQSIKPKVEEGAKENTKAVAPPVLHETSLTDNESV